MKKALDPIQAKARRQKRIVIGGAVLLGAVLAFQLPGMLGGDEQAAPPPPAATGTTPEAAPPPGNEELASAVPPAPTKLPAEPDPAPAAGDGQLVSFSLFDSKDPFVQQLSASPTGEPSGGSEPEPPSAPTPPTSAPPAETPPPATTPPTTPPVETPPPSEAPPAPAPPAPAPPATTPPPAAPAAAMAKISVNGVAEDVKIGAAFPESNPLFRLVSIKDGVAQIAIAGGSLQDGAETVPVSKDKPLTLMNTADGTQYVIKLLSVS